jgi:hypothetical protein
MTAALLTLIAEAEARLAAGGSDSRDIETIALARAMMRDVENV